MPETILTNKVLIIDDEEFNLDILQEYLELDGYSVIPAKNGKEGFELLANNTDVVAIIVDRMMPVMDGISFVYMVKDNAELREIPIIMQTAASSPEQVKEGLNAGVYYYLAKPYKKDILLTILHSAILEFKIKKKLTDEAKKVNALKNLVSKTEFKFRTLDDANELSNFIGGLFETDKNVTYGILELMINAIEHGNLDITYEEKKKLIFENKHFEEVTRRLKLPEYKNKFATIMFEKTETHTQITIKDNGSGFDYKKYLTFSPDRALDPSGRGIATSKILSFDEIEYLGRGNEVVAKINNKKTW